MKAIGFTRPLPVSNPEALLDINLPEPELRPHDILVAVQAVSVNPVDVKVRAAHTSEGGAYRVLGYDAAGIVQAVGSEVRNSKSATKCITRAPSTVKVQTHNYKPWTRALPPKNRVRWILPKPPRCH